MSGPISTQEVYDKLVHEHAGPAVARAIARYHDLVQQGSYLNPWLPPKEAGEKELLRKIASFRRRVSGRKPLRSLAP